MFGNPVLHSLQTRQRRFGLFSGDACKYQTDVAPFAAVAARDAEAMRQLASLLALGETIYMMGLEPLEVPGLAFKSTLMGVQMEFPENANLPETPPHERAFAIETLSCTNAAEMLVLTEVAFPGYFRIRTCELGSYYGVRVDRRLVAMAGERMAFDRYKEISGVCTHPAHRGKGYAGALISRLLADHRRDGWLSCLHTGVANKRAIALYERLGFVRTGEVAFHRVVKSGD